MADKNLAGAEIIPFPGHVCFVIPPGEYADIDSSDPTFPRVIRCTAGCIFTYDGYAPQDWLGPDELRPGAERLHPWPPE
jgi:hypothetical protein